MYVHTFELDIVHTLTVDSIRFSGAKVTRICIKQHVVAAASFDITSYY